VSSKQCFVGYCIVSASIGYKLVSLFLFQVIASSEFMIMGFVHCIFF
jgi:hypothetical protein